MLYSDSTPLIHKTNKAVASKVTAFFSANVQKHTL